MSWIKLLGSAIGSFFAGIFGAFWRDRSVKKAEDTRIAGEQAETELRQQTQTKGIRDDVEAMPATGPDSANAVLHREFGRDG